MAQEDHINPDEGDEEEGEDQSQISDPCPQVERQAVREQAVYADQDDQEQGRDHDQVITGIAQDLEHHAANEALDEEDAPGNPQNGRVPFAGLFGEFTGVLFLANRHRFRQALGRTEMVIHAREITRDEVGKFPEIIALIGCVFHIIGNPHGKGAAQRRQCREGRAVDVGDIHGQRAQLQPSTQPHH